MQIPSTQYQYLTNAPVFTSYTPVLTSSGGGVSLGAGTSSGRYCVIGNLVIGSFDLEFGAGMAGGTGSYRVSLPFIPSASGFALIGIGMLTDEGTNRPMVTYLNQSPEIYAVILQQTTASFVSATSPFTWVAGDEIHGSFHYEKA